MIEEILSTLRAFAADWPLFQFTWLVGWLTALVLSLGGVVVVARNQIFLGAAISQASTLGIAITLGLGEWLHVHELWWFEHGEWCAATLAVVLSVAAALITARGGEAGRESHEAITGWVFLVAASLSVLIVAHSRHGLEEVHNLLFSTLIGATAVDLWVFGIFAAITVAVVAVFRRRLLLFSMDRPMAAGVGMNVRLWELAVAVWLGLAIGLALRASGLLYTFGCLVLPAMVAKSLVREVMPMFLIAPAVAVGTAVVGFIVSHRYDEFPPAQVTVALLCGLVALSWTVRFFLRRV